MVGRHFFDPLSRGPLAFRPGVAALELIEQGFGRVVFGFGGELAAAAKLPPATNYGDVHAGTIMERTGNPHDTEPHDTEPWEWRCGFYPGGPHGDHRFGCAATFEDARAAFDSAWGLYHPKCTEAGFEEWRD
jgi:hypothetical protein